MVAGSFSALKEAYLSENPVAVKRRCRQIEAVRAMRKSTDSIAQFQSLRLALSSERDTLQKRLQRLDAALAGDAPSSKLNNTSQKAKVIDRPTKQPSRPQNATNLRDAITAAIAKMPLSVREIVESVQKNGYTFASSNPVNSVGAFLYGTQGKKHFKRVNGKFRRK